MGKRALDIIPLHHEDAATAEVRDAKLLAYLGAHRAIVDTFAGEGPLMARCLATLEPSALAGAAAGDARVRVVFAQGDPGRPIVTEIVPRADDPGRGESSVESPAPPGLRVDGQERSLPIEAREELVLRCGQASITLKSDGKIVIKGSYVESRASATNRIKGAQVRIN